VLRCTSCQRCRRGLPRVCCDSQICQYVFLYCFSNGAERGILQHNSIPEKSQSVLEQEEEYTDGRQSAYDNRICPLRIRADVVPPRISEIVAVESNNSDGEDELEDAEDEAYVSAKGRAILE
jgi:hypothetical protein